jgi:hypothetical protein
MAFGVNLFFTILIQVLFANVTFSAHETRLRCSETTVTFFNNSGESIRGLCSTATATIHFLKSIDLETTENITIRIVEHIPDKKQADLFGTYNAETREVTILSYAKFEELARKNKKFLGIAFTEDVWRSFAAHELAHAISDQYISQDINNHTAGEYISAVTQLTVLTPESREKILNNYQNIGAYKSIDEISILYYLFAPNKFAVKCYLHFMSIDKPKEFIEQLVVKEDEFWDRF